MKNIYEDIIKQQKDALMFKSIQYKDWQHTEKDKKMYLVFQALADSYEDFANELDTLYEDVEHSFRNL